MHAIRLAAIDCLFALRARTGRFKAGDVEHGPNSLLNRETLSEAIILT